MRVHKKICKGFEVFEYYANNQWDFDNSNLRYLRTVINETERARYKIDAEGLDMMKYFEVSPRISRVEMVTGSNLYPRLLTFPRRTVSWPPVCTS